MAASTRSHSDPTHDPQVGDTPQQDIAALRDVLLHILSIFHRRRRWLAAFLFSLVLTLPIAFSTPTTFTANAVWRLRDTLPTVREIHEEVGRALQQQPISTGLFKHLDDLSTLEALVRDTDFEHRFMTERPPLARWWGQTRRAWGFGPDAEEERLAILGTLRRRLDVRYEERYLTVSVEWYSPDGAQALVVGVLETIAAWLREQEVQRLAAALDILGAGNAEAEAAVKRAQDATDAFMSERAAAFAVTHNEAWRPSQTVDENGVVQGSRWPLSTAFFESVRNDPTLVKLRTVLDRAEEHREDTQARLEAGKRAHDAAASLSEQRYDVLSPPREDPHARTPGKALRIIQAVLAAMGIALGTMLVAEIMAARVGGAWQLRRYLGLPVLGRVATRLGAPKPYAGLSRGQWLFTIMLGVLGVLLFALAGGMAPAAWLPFILLGGAWALWRLPLRVPLLLWYVVALVADNPVENPGMGLYRSILYTIGKPLYLPLAKSGAPGVLATGNELFAALLLGLATVRIIAGSNVDGAMSRPLSPAMRWTWLGSLAGLATMEVWGLARGGVFRLTLQQGRMQVYCLLLTLLFAVAMRRRRDLYWVLAAIFGAAVVRAIHGLYQYFTVILPTGAMQSAEGGDGGFVMMHSDAMLAAVVLVLAVVALLYQPRPKTLLWLAAVVPLVTLAMLVNNRRIAFVNIGFGVIYAYAFASVVLKRRVHKLLLYSFPLLLAYVVVGWNANGGWAKPVQTIKSVTESSDESSKTRDIENYNLITSFARNPLIGAGFGHEYTEFVVAHDISSIFSIYRYVPHNSILALWWQGGWLGFTLYWSLMFLICFNAARITRFAENDGQRLLAAACWASVAAYAMQGYADMGLQSALGTLLLAGTGGTALGLAERLRVWHR